MSNITLRYKGLNCFGETDELSGSDEIYLITVVTSVEGGRAVVRTEKHPVGISVYEDVDKGASFGGPIAPCYSGEARPLSLVVTLMEQDEGDPNAFRDRIDAVVKAGAAASAAEGVPIPEIGQKLLGDVANAVIGSGDDVISQVALTFEPDALIAEARKPRLREQEVEHTFFTFHSGQGATYKAYFDIVEEGGPISPGGQTRKHPHSGNFIQSSFGRQGNFELLVPVGGRLVHFFRANDEAGLPWHRVAELPNSVNAAGAALIQSNFGGNFEVVARLGDGLVFYFFDAAVLQWRGPFPILVDGQPITGVTGNPALIQSSFGRQGNFELLVPVGGRLVHFFRANDEAGLPWHRVAELPNSVNAAGAALIQSNFGGNFEVVARLGDGLVFYFFDAAVLQWRGPFPILVDGQPITGVTGF